MIFLNKIFTEESMTINLPEKEAKKVKIAVDRNPVETSFQKWAKPGHFSRTLAKGPNTTTWIWNLTCRCT
jgi:photosystem I P700 chlorophyll a apoprotein A1